MATKPTARTQPTLNDLLKEALAEIPNLDVDEEFMVRDLFKGYLWNRIKRADRLKLGTMFLAQVEAQGDIYDVEKVRKTTANQQVYKRKKK